MTPVYAMIQYTGWRVRARIVRFDSLRACLERLARYHPDNRHRKRRFRHVCTLVRP